MRSGAGSYSEPGSDLVQLTMVHHRHTEKAVLLSVDGNIEKAVWLPLSQITMTMPKPNHHHQRRVTMPEWLATKNKIV